MFHVRDYTLLKYLGNEEVVSIPEGIEEIECHAFENISSMKKLILPDSLTKPSENSPSSIGGEMNRFFYI